MRLMQLALQEQFLFDPIESLGGQAIRCRTLQLTGWLVGQDLVLRVERDIAQASLNVSLILRLDAADRLPGRTCGGRSDQTWPQS
jgi:hypothetical protein